MKITIYECVNGWAAVYGPDGSRMATCKPGAERPRAVEGVEIDVVEIPVNTNYKDFPISI